MPDTRTLIAGVLSTAFLLFCALPGHAASKWYRIELLIFEQPAGSGGERFQPLPELDYPQRHRFLIDQQRLADSEEEGASLDRYGRLLLREVAGEETGAATAESAALTAAGATTSSGANTADGSAVGEPGRAPRPIAFVLRPRSELEFRGKAAYMERVGGYRVLFHESWVQPIGDARLSRAIIIDRSGDGEDWPALQGSFTLSLSRYLHLETDLWLNTPGAYLPGAWRMPPPPRGPASIIDLRPPESEDAMESDGLSVSEQHITPEGEVEAAEDIEAVSDYPFRHAVPFRQKRKMRSREVHYVDHPLLGLVVKFTPVTWEDGDAPAESDVQAAIAGAEGN